MTAPIIPTAFLFRYTLRCPWRAVQRARQPLELGEECRVPLLGELDGLTAFADLRLAWNEAGIHVSADVRGNPDHPEACDGLDLWLDTRDTRTIHRASRFCHHFFFAPTGGGRAGAHAWAVQRPIHRAREEAPLCDPADIRVRGRVRRDGYRIDAFLAAPLLSGFDPSLNTRLGFYYRVRDRERGEQTLTALRGFPFAEDPSVWATLELVQ
jgi:hypothetical protein